MLIEKPVRARHTYTQEIRADAGRVFPLLCPVREAEWEPGWDPNLVISESGVAEPGCVFVTDVDGRTATWVITRHDARAGRVSMLEIIPDYVVIELDIHVRPAGADACECDVTYTYTGLSGAGKAFVRERTEQWYRGFMRQWEHALNEYLAEAK